MDRSRRYRSQRLGTSTVLAGAIWIGLLVLEGAGLALAARNDIPDRTFYTALGIAFAAIAAVGVLIVARRPRNAIGWLFLGTMVDIGTLIFFEQYSLYGLQTRPGSVPGALWAAWAANWMWVAGILPFMAFVPLLFPTGRLPTPRWRPLAWVAGGLGLVASIAYAFGPTIEGPSGRPIGNPLGVDALAGVAALVDGPGRIAFAMVILLSLSSLVTRYRDAGEVERTQLKWVVFAFTLLALQLAVTTVLEATILPGAGDTAVGSALALLGLLAVPLTCAIAILKHRLYDIDRIINRTITYTLLTAFLALVYSGLVVALQSLVGRAQQSPLAVAVSTLAAAALFRPARARIQGLIDRRFNRRRYDAVRTIDGFTARLRDEIDLDALTAHLLDVVDETMEPARMSLWLKGWELSGEPVR